MRRLTLTAMSVAVVLSACSEQNRETPTEPSVQSLAKAATGTCQAPFPTTALTSKTGAMFAGSSVAGAASAKMRSIQSQCANGKVGNAQHEALDFVDYMLKKYGQNQLPQGTALSFADLTSTLFIAVGLQGGIDPNVFGPRGGAGVFTPGSPFLLRNQAGTAAVSLDGDAFTQPTLITIIPLPDSPQLVNTGGRTQFAPFYDYNAANAAGNHHVSGENGARIGFCTDPGDAENPQIGHNPRPENSEVSFEVLPALPHDEYLALGLTCPDQANDPSGEISLNMRGGLDGLALSAWHKVAGYARPLAESLFLPQSLHAAVLTNVGLGGRGSNMSPFGGVDDSPPGHIEIQSDPAERNFAPGQPISWNCEGTCFPSVRVVKSSHGVAGVPVTARLFQSGEEATEVPFGNHSTTTVTTEGGEGSGYATFDNLIVSSPGFYRIEFSAPGATSESTGEFSVGETD
jgi:hypothetical protein